MTNMLFLEILSSAAYFSVEEMTVDTLRPVITYQSSTRSATRFTCASRRGSRFQLMGNVAEVPNYRLFYHSVGSVSGLRLAYKIKISEHWKIHDVLLLAHLEPAAK
jgi:hypothetical protein